MQTGTKKSSRRPCKQTEEVKWTWCGRVRREIGVLRTPMKSGNFWTM